MVFDRQTNQPPAGMSKPKMQKHAPTSVAGTVQSHSAFPKAAVPLSSNPLIPMKRFALLLSLLVGCGTLAFWWYRPTQVLKRRTQKVLHTLTLPASGEHSGRKIGIYALNDLLSSQVEFDAPPSLDQASGFFDRSEVASAYSWLCDQAQETRFDLQEIHSVAIGGDQADVAFSLVALVELPNARPVDGRYEVTFRWLKENDTWHLIHAKWVQSQR